MPWDDGNVRSRTTRFAVARTAEELSVRTDCSTSGGELGGVLEPGKNEMISEISNRLDDSMNSINFKEYT